MYTDDVVKLAFIFFCSVFPSLCFAVLQFHDAALIKTPRTRRQGAQNILYMCHFAVLHLRKLQKVHQKALEQYSLRCVLPQKSLLLPQKMDVSTDR